MVMWDEDGQHFRKSSPKQKANVMFRRVRVMNGRGEGGD